MPPTSPLSKHNTLVISRFLHIQTIESKDQGPHSDLNLGHRMRTRELQETSFMPQTLLLLLSPFLTFSAESVFSTFSLFPPAVMPSSFERSLSLGRFLYALPPLVSTLISNNHNHQYLQSSHPAQPKL